uniref:Glutathione S-transferase C-terminal domain-containing protein homolog n=1 Tax=Glossina palpalis gambiensis TaxID=67801 RepID=A0A1B0AUQ7_9MUSC
MDYLYLEILTNNLSNDEVEVFTTIPSFIALYVYRYLESPPNVKIKFVPSNLSCEMQLNFTHYLHSQPQKIMCEDSYTYQAIQDLRLPVYYKNGDIFVAGLCAVCRELVARQKNVQVRKLLGFKEGCLMSPSETSVWTRFCEVDIVKALKQLLLCNSLKQSIKEIPVEAVRFEKHMNEPVRMHNIYKLARERANQTKSQLNNDIKKTRITIDCKTPKEELQIEHKFAEGVLFTIADLILYPCLRLIFHFSRNMLANFPLTCSWFEEVDKHEPRCKAILDELCLYPSVHSVKEGLVSILSIPNCESKSLYKSDPKRYRPRKRVFTAQRDVDATLNKLQTLRLNYNSDCSKTFDQKSIDWQRIEPSHAKSCALPEERLERKRQQLENLANAAISLAEPGNRIIDFCSGTGHLGILLALHLPQCTIILMENKPESLQRAKLRALELKLSNIKFYQCNIDYFKGKFNIGTSLHACGTATDIVLQQCRQAKANFVCCPCCYGSLQSMPHITYPLSKQFRQVLSEKDFMYVAHTADQAHELGTLNCKPEITKQGQLCMDIVDTDRKLQAEDAGYEVILTRLKPEDCTPKNRLLVGFLKKES